MFRRLIIHPVLFAIYPILALYAYNMEQLVFRHTLIPSGIVIGVIVILFLILNLIIKNKQKSALILSAIILLFFSYGHVNDFIRYLSLLACIMGSYYLLRSQSDISKITQIANIFSIGLVIVTIANISMSKFTGTSEIELNKYRPKMVKPILDEIAKENLPDIYYIVLDGYARSDILNDIYHYDNSEFLDYLRQAGFRIAKQSRSNYCQTLLSLSSTLNMIYLDELANDIGVESKERKPLISMFKHNYVFDFLKQYDYTIMAIASGYSATELRDDLL